MKVESEAELQKRLSSNEHGGFYHSRNPLVSWIHWERLKTIKSLVPEGGSILDVGCGDGFLFKVIQNRNNVFGAEISAERLKRARKDAGWVEYVRANGSRLPYKSESFDAVVCSEVLEHVYEPENVVKEMTRVCKKAGSLIITIPNETNWEIARLLTLRFPIRIEDHLNSLNPSQLENWSGRKIKEKRTLPLNLPFPLSLTFIARL